jgi:hypothetical protein
MQAAALTWRWTEVVAANAPSPRSSMQISAVGSRLYVFGGEGGPHESHFGYGEPVDNDLYVLDLDGAEKRWTTVRHVDSAPSPRLGHGQAIVEHEDQTFLYVFGGRQPETPGAVYDGNEKIASLNDMVSNINIYPITNSSPPYSILSSLFLVSHQHQ